jgi:hypothetical protein
MKRLTHTIKQRQKDMKLSDSQRATTNPETSTRADTAIMV